MRYAVEVAYMMRRRIMVNAPNEKVAKERAERVVREWRDVRSCTAVEVREAFGAEPEGGAGTE